MIRITWKLRGEVPNRSENRTIYTEVCSSGHDMSIYSPHLCQPEGAQPHLCISASNRLCHHLRSPWFMIQIRLLLVFWMKFSNSRNSGDALLEDWPIIQKKNTWVSVGSLMSRRATKINDKFGFVPSFIASNQRMTLWMYKALVKNNSTCTRVHGCAAAPAATTCHTVELNSVIVICPRSIYFKVINQPTELQLSQNLTRNDQFFFIVSLFYSFSLKFSCFRTI